MSPGPLSTLDIEFRCKRCEEYFHIADKTREPWSKGLCRNCWDHLGAIVGLLSRKVTPWVV